MKLVDLQEARYAGEAPSEHQVYELYQKAIANYKPHTEDDPVIIGTKIFARYKSGYFVVLDFWFHEYTNERDNVNWIKKFMANRNLPYCELDRVDDVEDYPEWVPDNADPETMRCITTEYYRPDFEKKLLQR